MRYSVQALFATALVCVLSGEVAAQPEVIYEPCGWSQPYEWICAKGVHGLEINGKMYDVDFLFGQFTYWFPDPYMNGFWGNQTLAQAAANATLAALIDSDAEQIAGPNELGYIGYPHGAVSFQFAGMGPIGPLVPSEAQLTYEMYFQKHTGTPETGVFYTSSFYWTMHAKLTETTPDADTLLRQLLTDVAGVGPGTSLADKIIMTQAYYEAGDIAATCTMLDAFIHEVSAQRGKMELTTEVGSEFLADATAIKEAIGCN